MTTNLQSEAAAKVTSLPEGPIEATYLDMVPFYFPTSAIEARLVSSLSRALELTRVPPRVHADRPLEIDLGARGLDTGAGATGFISAHACLAIEIEVTGHSSVSYTLPLSARSSSGGWVARALIHPAAWVNAASITVVSFSLARRPLLSDCLPVTLEVGYNHAPAPAGAVLLAAQTGDVRALQAALDVGGSTEEADDVSVGQRSRCERGEVAATVSSNLTLLSDHLKDEWTVSFWASKEGHVEALRTLLAAGANPAAASEVRLLWAGSREFGHARPLA